MYVFSGPRGGRFGCGCGWVGGWGVGLDEKLAAGQLP